MTLTRHGAARTNPGDELDAFLAAIAAGDAARARNIAREEGLAAHSLHVAAALGDEAEVRRPLEADGAQLTLKIGDPPRDPLLWLCYSPCDGLEAVARALLEAGADPNTRDGGRYGVPALYAVTGHRHAPRIARLLLEAGADPNDGESAFHAAERFHVEALELLLEHGVDLNHVGDWGNTPLYFLLRYRDVAREERVGRGLRWLLEHGADVHAHRGDVRSAWLLAKRGGHDELADLLARAGATAEPLSPADELMAACGRGDAEAAERLAMPLAADEHALLPDAASRGRFDVVRACLAAGFPVDTAGEDGAAALHHAAIRGHTRSVRELLLRGAERDIADPQHDATPLGWAEFGRDVGFEADGDYEACIRLLTAG